MDMFETVETSVIKTDPLVERQKRDVEQMRTSLLLCNTEDGNLAKQAIRNITVLRVYHQIARIIKYLDMMDKIENKMYEAIDNSLNTADVYDGDSWAKLMAMSSKLQEIMIDSQKLLDPYLKLKEYIEAPIVSGEVHTPDTMGMDSATRNSLRVKAQAVLLELDVEVKSDE